ncbi:MAG: AraC family transcriptional regulator [Eubacteriales bacterium]|nr:AraC family transcriptional regulator [Eubacteriales bacterium]
MKKLKGYLDNHLAGDLLAAFDEQDLCVSYSEDYRKEELCQVHNSCELLFVESGEADYQINEEIYHVSKNTVLIIGATDRHRFWFTQVPYKRYGLNVMPSYLQTLPIIGGYLNIYQTQSQEGHKNLMQIDGPTFRRMVGIVRELHEEAQEGVEGRETMIYALLLELTILLKRLLHAESQEHSETYKIMNEIKNYIDLYYKEDLSLAELSRLFYLQPNTISKNFRKIWGKNINQYIHSVRITNAVRILEAGEVGITELAEMVGYGNVNTFLRQFREKMDVSPLQYRKRMAQMMQEREEGGETWEKTKNF